MQAAVRAAAVWAALKRHGGVGGGGVLRDGDARHACAQKCKGLLRCKILATPTSKLLFSLFFIEIQK